MMTDIFLIKSNCFICLKLGHHSLLHDPHHYQSIAVLMTALLVVPSLSLQGPWCPRGQLEPVAFKPGARWLCCRGRCHHCSLAPRPELRPAEAALWASDPASRASIAGPDLAAAAAALGASGPEPRWPASEEPRLVTGGD